MYPKAASFIASLIGVWDMKRTFLVLSIVTLVMNANIFLSMASIPNSILSNSGYSDNTEVLEPPEQCLNKSLMWMASCSVNGELKSHASNHEKLQTLGFRYLLGWTSDFWQSKRGCDSIFKKLETHLCPLLKFRDAPPKSLLEFRIGPYSFLLLV